MFASCRARRKIRQQLLSRGLESRWLEMADEYYPLVSTLSRTLFGLGCRVRAVSLTDVLWVVAAVAGP